MTISIPSLEGLGTIEFPSAAAPIVLQKRNAVWLLLEGKIDLFVSLKSSDDQPRAQHHWLRIEPGGALFGLPAEADGMQLRAAVLPGTKLLAFTLDELGGMILRNDPRACALLEDWVQAVGGTLFTSNFPTPLIDASPLKEIAAGEAARAIVPAEGVMWVSHRRGESYILADRLLPSITDKGYFPISRRVWIEAEPGSLMHLIPTCQLPQLDEHWRGLHGFHCLAQRVMASRLQDALNAEDGLIRRKSKADATLLERALQRLTTPIRKGRRLSDGNANCSDPVFLVMEAVAQEQNMTLTAPVEMLRGEPLADPIAAVARASRIRVRKVVLKGTWWRQHTGPLVCFSEHDHTPLALLPRSGSTMQLYDPALKSSVVVSERVASTLNPMAYMLYQPFPASMAGAIGLLRFGLSQCKQEIRLIAGTGIAAGMLAVISPYIIDVIFDRVIPGAERNQLVQMALLLCVLAITSSMFLLARGFAILRLQGKMDATIQAAVWDRLLGLPVSFFRDYSSGDLAQRSMGISHIREVLTGSALNAMLSSVFSIFSWASLFYYSSKLAVIATILVGTAFVVSLGVGSIQVHYARQVLRLSGILSSKLLQFVGGVAKLRVSSTECRAFAVWAAEFATQERLSVSAKRAANAILVLNSVIPVLSVTVIYYVNARYLMANGIRQLSTGEFLGFMAAYIQLQSAVLMLGGTILEVANIVPLYERAVPILRALPESAEIKSDPGALVGDIEVSHVSFSYREESPTVLRDLSLRIRPGQSVALVGSSGCGKSTLFRLLLGFERPRSGAVYFDGQDLSGLDAQAIRRQIGVVLQTSRLVSGSIFENIVGSSPLTIADAWEACRTAGIEEDIRRMPMGLYTKISDGGGGISGGQRQRIMIARAIVSKPKVLLFDEATSALDNATQATVTQGLARLQATRIFIAHRLSTVMNADQIFVFDTGRVVERGTYAELIGRSGLFHELAKRQLT